MENNFTFFNLNGKDEFSKLNGSDLQELIVQLNDYYLDLRESLGFDKSITFGLELEFEKMKVKVETLFDIFSKLEVSYLWNNSSDGSLVKGWEIQSPIFKDNPDTWRELSTVCEFVSSYAKVGKHCAGHVHVGTHVLGYEIDTWLKFLKLWSVYENIIYRFSYNEYLNKLPGICYCSPTAVKFYDLMKSYSERKDTDIDDLICSLSHERAQAVNFQNVNTNHKRQYYGNTIEFRCPNGTLNPVVWQNNVNLFAKLILYSKSNNFDEDIIEKRNNKELSRVCEPRYSLYNQIYLEQALELCDLIFDRNIDKIYFLKQYLKSFQTVDSEDKKMKKTLKFTKSKK